jgi:hypothetical protein
LSFDLGFDGGDDRKPKAQLETVNTEPLPSIKKVLCVSDEQGKATWISFTALPYQVMIQLQTRFDADYVDTEGHKKDLRRILECQARYLRSGRCINNIVHHRCGKEMTWAASDGNQHRACD